MELALSLEPSICNLRDAKMHRSGVAVAIEGLRTSSQSSLLYPTRGSWRVDSFLDLQAQYNSPYTLHVGLEAIVFGCFESCRF